MHKYVLSLKRKKKANSKRKQHEKMVLGFFQTMLSVILCNYMWVWMLYMCCRKSVQFSYVRHSIIEISQIICRILLFRNHQLTFFRTVYGYNIFPTAPSFQVYFLGECFLFHVLLLLSSVIFHCNYASKLELLM